jgi:hypothetical protein
MTVFWMLLALQIYIYIYIYIIRILIESTFTADITNRTIIRRQEKY